MISFREFVNAYRELELSPTQPVIVHASLSAVGQIRGGAETVLGALLPMVKGLMTPTFTYKTMIIPEIGPPNNGADYGTGKDTNRLAEFFQPDLPADTMMGLLPETLRKHPQACRSSHPILSFAGIRVENALEAQCISEPLAPLRVLAEDGGAVLLIGVDHTVNTSIHYAEQLAGRKQFVRWALTPLGVRECPGFPGCSQGFEQAAPYLSPFTSSTRIGGATLRLIPLAPLLMTLTDLLRSEPLALLCQREDCRCEDVRRAHSAQYSS
jgi:aminoglycoside 3-N-acetyltransferase